MSNIERPTFLACQSCCGARTNIIRLPPSVLLPRPTYRKVFEFPPGSVDETRDTASLCAKKRVPRPPRPPKVPLVVLMRQPNQKGLANELLETFQMAMREKNPFRRVRGGYNNSGPVPRPKPVPSPNGVADAAAQGAFGGGEGDMDCGDSDGGGGGDDVFSQESTAELKADATNNAFDALDGLMKARISLMRFGKSHSGADAGKLKSLVEESKNLEASIEDVMAQDEGSDGYTRSVSTLIGAASRLVKSMKAMTTTGTAAMDEDELSADTGS